MIRSHCSSPGFFGVDLMGWLNRLYTVDILSDRRMYHKCYTNINMHALVLYAALDGSDAEGLLPLQLYAIAVLTNFSPPPPPPPHRLGNPQVKIFRPKLYSALGGPKCASWIWAVCIRFMWMWEYKMARVSLVRIIAISWHFEIVSVKIFAFSKRGWHTNLDYRPGFLRENWRWYILSHLCASHAKLTAAKKIEKKNEFEKSKVLEIFPYTLYKFIKMMHFYFSTY